MDTRSKKLARYLKTDRHVTQIVKALRRAYGAAHPKAVIEAYMVDWGIIRVRVTDPDFEGKSDKEREDPIWAVLQTLPAEALQELHVLILITPGERKRSPGSALFDNDRRRTIRRTADTPLKAKS